MAIFHCQVKSLSRSSGRSAIAASAYRAGDKLIDNQDGTIHDYTRRSGVVMDQLILPGNMLANASERNHLWNVAELAEKRRDARTAREYEIALPSELSEVQRGNLAQAFSKLLADRYGVAIDLAIHSPSKEGDKRNHHAHLLATTRQVNRAPNGDLILRDKASIELSDKKRRELNLGTASDEITKVRKLWEELANQHLKLAGQTENIDSRSLADQGIDRIPTQHLGPAATAIERRTKQPSRKRINQLLERKEQIENAREEKKLAKEYKETEKVIINLSSQLQTAKLEHQEHTIIEEGLQNIWAAFDKHEKEQAAAAERLAKKKEQELKRKTEEWQRREENKQPIIAAESTKKEEDIFLISIYYERNQPGNSNNIGVTIEREFVDADNLKKYSKYYKITEPSSTDPRTTPYIWFNSTSSNESYILHIHEINGDEPEAEDYQKIANLIGARFDCPIELDNSEQKIKSPEDDSLTFDGF